MDKKSFNDWIMYHQVHRMKREGHSNRSIARFLGMSDHTVKRYAAMDEADFAARLKARDIRPRLLKAYEQFIKDRLTASPAASASQVHDWLKEHHKDFPRANPKTVYNFVMAVRQKYGIPKEETGREYFVVEELPYGFQAQADFGQYTMRHAETKRKKVYFFAMMLSRSRMKFLRFSESPFTTRAAIDAHEEAFGFFKGVPQEVVYDQDRLFLIDERLGELLLTQDFKSYVFEQEFRVHFCRKADPESKGKIENVVKYVKNNFLYGRAYYDIETLQSEALQWLQRTGNGMPHTTTRKIPLGEWAIEQPHLATWCSVKILPAYILRFVRKDNTFSYNGNFYSVPQGTYQKKESAVQVYLKGNELHVYYDGQKKLLCKHTLIESKGYKIINADHKRDKSQKINDLVATTAALFLHPALAIQYFELIRLDKKRYLRDQVQAIRDTVHGRNKQLVAEVLEKCVAERYLSAGMFKELLSLYEAENRHGEGTEAKIILLDPNSTRKAETQPDKSNMDAYEKAFGD